MYIEQKFSKVIRLPIESLLSIPGLHNLNEFQGMEANVELKYPIEQPYNYGYLIQRYS
jgi:hypothetical protein